jgi:hypothetical protein
MTAATTIEVHNEAPAPSQAVYCFIGLAAATVLPALFWVTIAAALSQAAGSALSVQALITTGAVITLFLAVVCAPIMLKAQA